MLIGKVVGVLSAVQALFVLVIDLPLWHALTGVDDPVQLVCFAGYCVSMTAASLAREGVHGIGRHLRAAISDVLAGLSQLVLGLVLNAAGRVSVSTLLACGIAGFALQILLCRRSAALRGRPRGCRVPDRPR